MKKIFFALLLIFAFGRTYSRSDSTGTRFKIFLDGSMIILLNWTPSNGQLYPLDWYEEKVDDHSFGYSIGLTGCVRLYRSDFYLCSGATYAICKFDQFRTSMAPDWRRNNPYQPTYDTLYREYTQKNLQIPLLVSTPIYTDSFIYFGLLTGLNYSLNFKEDYILASKEDTKFSNPGSKYQSTGFIFGPVVEFPGKKIPLIVRSSMLFNQTLDSNSDDLFLNYRQAFTWTFSLGYGF